MSLGSATERAPRAGPSSAKWVATTIAALILWGMLYSQLSRSRNGSRVAAASIPTAISASRSASSLYDTPKVLMLLTLVVFGMGVVRSFFSPERTRALLAGKREGSATCWPRRSASSRPFCSCSAVPLFIGFVTAGVPLGVTFSFLIAAPMVNEVALGLLFALLGWKVALTYLGFGLGVAIVAGWVIGRLHLEALARGVGAQDAQRGGRLAAGASQRRDRIKAGLDAVREIVGKVWPWIIAGIAVGALHPRLRAGRAARLDHGEATPGGRCPPRS